MVSSSGPRLSMSRHVLMIELAEIPAMRRWARDPRTNTRRVGRARARTRPAGRTVRAAVRPSHPRINLQLPEGKCSEVPSQADPTTQDLWSETSPWRQVDATDRAATSSAFPSPVLNCSQGTTRHGRLHRGVTGLTAIPVPWGRPPPGLGSAIMQCAIGGDIGQTLSVRNPLWRAVRFRTWVRPILPNRGASVTELRLSFCAPATPRVALTPGQPAG
jgi:hypothetical protein